MYNTRKEKTFKSIYAFHSRPTLHRKIVYLWVDISTIKNELGKKSLFIVWKKKIR